MKWTKANENSPTTEGYYYSYRNEGKVYKQLAFWYADEKEWSTQVFEWLDESAGEQPPAVEGEQDELWREVGKTIVGYMKQKAQLIHLSKKLSSKYILIKK